MVLYHNTHILLKVAQLPSERLAVILSYAWRERNAPLIVQETVNLSLRGAPATKQSQERLTGLVAGVAVLRQATYGHLTRNDKNGGQMTSKNDVPEIRPQQIDAVLRFLPIFEQPGHAFGEWHSPEGQIPYYSMNREARDFVQTLYGQQILFSFDWMSWQKEAERYISAPEALETADLLVLRKLLTTHVRKDRFIEGHLASTWERGHITAILRRLKEIRDQIG